MSLIEVLVEKGDEVEVRPVRSDCSVTVVPEDEAGDVTVVPEEEG